MAKHYRGGWILGAALGVAAVSALAYSDDTTEKAQDMPGKAEHSIDQAAKSADKSIDEAGESMDEAGKAAGQEMGEAHEQMAGSMDMKSPEMNAFLQDVALNQLHHANEKEIQLSELAISRTKSPEVKSLATRIRDDHKRNNEKLKEIAKGANVKLMSYSASTVDRVEMDRLKDAKDKKFDEMYLSLMEWGHRRTAGELKVAADRVVNANVKAFLQQTIPTIEGHQSQAHQQAMSMMSSSASG